MIRVYAHDDRSLFLTAEGAGYLCGGADTWVHRNRHYNPPHDLHEPTLVTGADNCQGLINAMNDHEYSATQFKCATLRADGSIQLLENDSTRWDYFSSGAFNAHLDDDEKSDPPYLHKLTQSRHWTPNTRGHPIMYAQGEHFSLVLTDFGTVYSHGCNKYGQRGIGIFQVGLTKTKGFQLMSGQATRHDMAQKLSTLPGPSL